MKFYFHKSKVQIKEYNVRLIEKILGSYITPVVSESDYVMISICDISEINELQKAKAYGKPIVCGGMVSDYPIINELSDYVWHGEVYGFKKELDAGKHLDEMPSMSKQGERSLVIDQRIEWAKNPIIKVGNRAMYYYVSKSCPVKCKYCYISYVRKYQVVPEVIYRKAAKVAGKNLMPIAAFNPYGTVCKTNIGETFLKNYVSGKVGSGSRTLRAGVEFCDQELSKNLAKNVTRDDFYEAIRRSERDGTKLIMYFIAGIEEQPALEDYFGNIPISYSNKNPVTIVFTYIDPQPFTPFYQFDITRKIGNIDAKKIYHIATQRNKRVRIMPLAGPSKSTLRTLLGRATNIEQYKLIKSLKKADNGTIIDKIGKTYPELLGSESLEEVKSRRRIASAVPYWGEVINVF